MIHAHSFGQATHYYGGRTALASGARRAQLYKSFTIMLPALLLRSEGHGFQASDRLALLLTKRTRLSCAGICLCLAGSDRCSGEHPPVTNGNQ
jgi:hypothetical protein